MIKITEKLQIEPLTDDDNRSAELLSEMRGLAKDVILQTENNCEDVFKKLYNIDGIPDTNKHKQTYLEVASACHVKDFIERYDELSKKYSQIKLPKSDAITWDSGIHSKLELAIGYFGLDFSKFWYMCLWLYDYLDESYKVGHQETKYQQEAKQFVKFIHDNINDNSLKLIVTTKTHTCKGKGAYETKSSEVLAYLATIIQYYANDFAVMDDMTIDDSSKLTKNQQIWVFSTYLNDYLKTVEKASRSAADKYSTRWANTETPIRTRLISMMASLLWNDSDLYYKSKLTAPNNNDRPKFVKSSHYTDTVSLFNINGRLLTALRYAPTISW